MRAGLSFTALLAMAGTAGARTPAPSTYLLTMHYDDGGQLVGDPKLRVRAGEAATVMVQDAAKNSFSISITANPQDDGSLSVTSILDTSAAGGVHRRATPRLLVLPNRLATLEIGELSPVTRPVRVTFTYQPIEG